MELFMIKKKKEKNSHTRETNFFHFYWLLNVLLSVHSQKQSWLKLYELLI